MSKHNWTKSDKWTRDSGPHYRHDTGLVSIIGDWGTTGDNLRGWRKSRDYTVLGRDRNGRACRIDSCSDLKNAKKIAEKYLQGLKTDSTVAS